MKEITQYTSKVFCTLQVEGLHRWPECPFEETAYLRDNHRHVFHIKAEVFVAHHNRAQEFIMLKHEIETHLRSRYWDEVYKCCSFGSMSCEMIAAEILDKFHCYQVSVSEDGENGAILTRICED